MTENSPPEGAKPDTLESVISGNLCTLTLNGRVFEFRRWGLRKVLTLGSKVMNLVGLIQNHLKDNPGVLNSETAMVEILAIVSEDVLVIVAHSMTSPSFKDVDEAVAWMDDNLSLADLLVLARAVYDQNLSGDKLGKILGDVKGAAEKVASLSASSSKN